MQNQNMIAKILKIYAIVNAVAGLFIFLSMQDSYVDLINSLSFVVLGLCLVFSFGIYAFGEVIQLLQDIKDNTSRITDSATNQYANNNSDDLPTI